MRDAHNPCASRNPSRCPPRTVDAADMWLQRNDGTLVEVDERGWPIEGDEDGDE